MVRQPPSRVFVCLVACTSVTGKEAPPQRRCTCIHLRALLRSLVLKPRVHAPPCSSSLIHKMSYYLYTDEYWWLPTPVRSYYIVDGSRRIYPPPGSGFFEHLFASLFALFGNIADVFWLLAIAAFFATVMLPPMMDIIIYLSVFYIAVSALHTRLCLHLSSLSVQVRIFRLIESALTITRIFKFTFFAVVSFVIWVGLTTDLDF